jgi:hypothetical protein
LTIYSTIHLPMNAICQAFATRLQPFMSHLQHLLRSGCVIFQQPMRTPFSAAPADRLRPEFKIQKILFANFPGWLIAVSPDIRRKNEYLQEDYNIAH